MKKHNKIILIDCANMIQRYSSMEGVAKWTPWSLIFNHICWIFEKLEPSIVIAAWEGTNSRDIRRKIYKEYKSERDNLKESRKKVDIKVNNVPLGPWVKQHLLSNFPLHQVEINNLEADDVISICVKQFSESNENDIIIIVSTDQDFYQLINEKVAVFNPITKKFLTQTIIREKFGITNLKNLAWIKAIIGDNSDNIPGIPNVGLKTAQKLLHPILNSEDEWTYEQVIELLQAKKQIPKEFKSYYEIIQLNDCLDLRGKINAENRIEWILKNPAKYNEKKLIEIYASSGIHVDIPKEKIQRKLMVLSEFSFLNRRK